MSQQPYYAHGGKAPVVVQGTAVSYNPPVADAAGTTVPVNTYNHGPSEPLQIEEVQKQEAQPKRCNDVGWAILFYAHVVVMAFFAGKYGPQMNGGGERRLMESLETVDEGDDRAHLGFVLQAFSMVVTSVTSSVFPRDTTESRALEENGEMAGISFLVAITFLIGSILSTFSLAFMMKYAAGLIKFGLIFNIIAMGLMALAGLLSGALGMAMMGGFGMAFSAYYACKVWARIPFAASNLITASTSVKSNFGLSFFAYTSLFFLVAWSILWAVAFTSTISVTYGCDGDGQCESQPNGFVIFLFLVSYFWSHQVIKNVVHVTVAGTVGTWWFSPLEASSCCSRGVRDSFVRSITYSFGSICFGSLIVAIIEAAKEMLHLMREQDDGALMCIAECCLGCLEAIVEYFNRWAFVYVGLYGFTFIEAGKNVIQLFKSRGWTTIITDNLIDNVLFMVSIGVGLITGTISLLIAKLQGLDAEEGFLGVAFV